MANLQMFRFVFCLLKIVMSEPQWFQRARMKSTTQDEMVLTGLDQISYVALFYLRIMGIRKGIGYCKHWFNRCSF